MVYPQLSRVSSFLEVILVYPKPYISLYVIQIVSKTLLYIDILDSLDSVTLHEWL